MFKRNKRGETRSHKSLAEVKTHNRYKKIYLSDWTESYVICVLTINKQNG